MDSLHPLHSLQSLTASNDNNYQVKEKSKMTSLFVILKTKLFQCKSYP